MSATPQPFSRIVSKLLAAIFISTAMFMQTLPANALGGGGSTPTAPSCPEGEVWSKKWKKCILAQHKDVTGEERYEQGRVLAKTGKFSRAIEILKTADQKNPHVLNYLGFSYRKSGDLKTAIGYYKAALKIDPNFVLARSYLGEGYVKAGRIDLAKLELEQIAKRCGKTCKEYIQLAMVIDGNETATY